MLGYDGMMLDSYFPNNQAISKHWWFRDPPQQKPCYTQSQKRPDLTKCLGWNSGCFWWADGSAGVNRGVPHKNMWGLLCGYLPKMISGCSRNINIFCVVWIVLPWSPMKYVYIYTLTQMMCIFWWRLLDGMGEHPNENWGDQDPAVVPVSDEAPRCCILQLGEGWCSTLGLTCYFLTVFYLWNLMTPMSYEVTLIWKIRFQGSRSMIIMIQQ